MCLSSLKEYDRLLNPLDLGFAGGYEEQLQALDELGSVNLPETIDILKRTIDEGSSYVCAPNDPKTMLQAKAIEVLGQFGETARTERSFLVKIMGNPLNSPLVVKAAVIADERIRWGKPCLEEGDLPDLGLVTTFGLFSYFGLVDKNMDGISGYEYPVYPPQVAWDKGRIDLYQKFTAQIDKDNDKKIYPSECLTYLNKMLAEEILFDPPNDPSYSALKGIVMDAELDSSIRHEALMGINKYNRDDIANYGAMKQFDKMKKEGDVFFQGEMSALMTKISLAARAEWTRQWQDKENRLPYEKLLRKILVDPDLPVSARRASFDNLVDEFILPEEDRTEKLMAMYRTMETVGQPKDFVCQAKERLLQSLLQYGDIKALDFLIAHMRLRQNEVFGYYSRLDEDGYLTNMNDINKIRWALSPVDHKLRSDYWNCVEYAKRDSPFKKLCVEQLKKAEQLETKEVLATDLSPATFSEPEQKPMDPGVTAYDLSINIFRFPPQATASNDTVTFAKSCFSCRSYLAATLYILDDEGNAWPQNCNDYGGAKCEVSLGNNDFRIFLRGKGARIAFMEYFNASKMGHGFEFNYEYKRVGRSQNFYIDPIRLLPHSYPEGCETFVSQYRGPGPK